MAVALIAAAAAVVLWRATSALETSTVRAAGDSARCQYCAGRRDPMNYRSKFSNQVVPTNLKKRISTPLLRPPLAGIGTATETPIARHDLSASDAIARLRGLYAEQKKNLVVEIGGAREEAAAKKGGRTKVAEVEVVEAAISPVDVAPDVTPDAPQAKA